VSVEEPAQHVARRIGHQAPRRPARICLLGICAREFVERGNRIGAACRGEAPRADRGADQVPDAGSRRQPLAEHRAIEARDAERLRSPGRPRHDLDVRRDEALRANALQGAFTGA
jgi:hypothetical protein